MHTSRDARLPASTSANRSLVELQGGLKFVLVSTQFQLGVCWVVVAVLTISITWVLWVAPALDDWVFSDEAVGGGAVQEEHIGHQLQPATTNTQAAMHHMSAT